MPHEVNLREPDLVAAIYHSNCDQIVLMRQACLFLRDDNNLLCAGGCVSEPSA